MRTYKNVLIIDDSDFQRVLSEAIIRKHSFANSIVSVDSVLNGINYLKSLIQQPENLPAVIFLDVNMPEYDGFDFLDHYLQFPEEIQKRCSIFMISATNSEEDMKRLEMYPIVRKFFHKPLSEDILDYIRAYI